MNEKSESIETVPKLALTRLEAAKALGQSPATIDRLTKRGLLRPCRATRRPIYAVKEIERFLKETTSQAEWCARE
jgi:IS30 family transposase